MTKRTCKLSQNPFTLRAKSSAHVYVLLGLVALELLMSFSFLGYIHVGSISITFAYIPVLIAGCLLKPADAVIVGLTFGAASLWKATASYVSSADQVFSPFASGSPLNSLLLSIGARIVFAFIIGLFYFWARNTRHPMVWIGIISFFAKNLHSVLVYGALQLLFPELGYSAAAVFKDFFTWNNLLLMLFTALVVCSCWGLWNSSLIRKHAKFLTRPGRASLKSPNRVFFLCAVAVLLLFFSGAVAFYFVSRMRHMLSQYGIFISDTAYTDLLHLQIQFLLGILSLALLVVLLLIFGWRYASYKESEARQRQKERNRLQQELDHEKEKFSHDSLTGVLSRADFQRQVTHYIEQDEGAVGYLLLFDLDNFKTINDTLGHPEGDKVLVLFASCLKQAFRGQDPIGRLGGDEFIAFLPNMTSSSVLSQKLQNVLDLTSREFSGYQKYALSASIGAAKLDRQTGISDYDSLYKCADEALYRAKNLGKGRYYIEHDSRCPADSSDSAK